MILERLLVDDEVDRRFGSQGVEWRSCCGAKDRSESVELAAMVSRTIAADSRGAINRRCCG
jgi:hypothetical protein